MAAGEPPEYILPGLVDANRITVDFQRTAQGRPAELDGRPHAADARPARRDGHRRPDEPQEKGGGAVVRRLPKPRRARPLERGMMNLFLGSSTSTSAASVCARAPPGPYRSRALHVLAAQSLKSSRRAATPLWPCDNRSVRAPSRGAAR